WHGTRRRSRLDCMRRREFITLLGGAAAAPLLRPLALRAQQGRRRLGVLMGYDQSDAEARSLIDAFRHDLAGLGWSDGSNLLIDYRWAVGNIERMRSFAEELVALSPDVILANTTPVTGALQQKTRTIPIVFVIVSDPVGAGFVDSLARPGGNI